MIIENCTFDFTHVFQFFITGLSFTGFCINPVDVKFRIGGTLTLLLTSVAFKIAVSNTLPTISYLTKLVSNFMFMFMSNLGVFSSSKTKIHVQFKLTHFYFQVKFPFLFFFHFSPLTPRRKTD